VSIAGLTQLDLGANFGEGWSNRWWKGHPIEPSERRINLQGQLCGDVKQDAFT
jgi:sRNA-binding protein